MGGLLGAVIRVDPQTGVQTLMTAGGFLEGPEGLLVLPEPSGQWLFASGLALILLLGRGRLRSWKTGYVLVIEAREGVRKWDV